MAGTTNRYQSLYINWCQGWLEPQININPLKLVVSRVAKSDKSGVKVAGTTNRDIYINALARAVTPRKERS